MKGMFFGGVTALALLAGPALAADMPVKAPPMVKAFNWSGFYLGGTIGYNNGDMHWDFFNAGTFLAENPFEISGWNGGAFGGLQLQTGNFVFGVEANGLWGRLDGFSVCPSGVHNCIGKVDDVWTVGGRVGYVWGGTGQLMSYVTGGFASAKATTDTVTIATGVLFDTGSARHDGWYIGTGLDFRLVGNWIAGFEYRHYELESAVHVAVPALATEDRRIKPKWDSWHFRLSYKFDWGAPFMVR